MEEKKKKKGQTSEILETYLVIFSKLIRKGATLMFIW